MLIRPLSAPEDLTFYRASYIIFIIKDFPLGHTFINTEIIKDLPHPLDTDATIMWNNGLLKGLVKATKKYQSYADKDGKTIRFMIYEMIQSVSSDLLEKAKKNVDRQWLKRLTNKKKK